MFSRRALTAAVIGIGLACAVPAAAQVEEGGLDFVDAFGVGYLEDGEAAMPTNMWKASRTEALLPLIRQVRTRQLTPSERMLLRRVALSPAARPDGEQAEAVLAERARILYELGEAEAAADLLGRLEENPRGLNAAELSVDLQLALGNEATACAALNDTSNTGAFWAQLRAVCAVLREETAAAELAVELAVAQGVEDPWFTQAVFAASLEEPGDVPARFDSGLNLALSTAVGLAPPINAVAAARPDLAAAMARRDTIPLGVRVQAAGVAAEAGLLTGEEHRQLYSDLLKTEGFEPARAIEVAVLALDDVTTDEMERARKLAMALRSSAGSPARFAAASRLFANDLGRIGRNSETARYGLIFAKSALAAGDLERSAAWVEATTLTDAPEPDAFDQAMTRGLLVLAGHKRSDNEVLSVAEALVAAAGEDTARQLTAARLFALWTARHVPPPAIARSLMAEARPEAGAEAENWRMLAVRAAASADAAGEVVVATLARTQGDPSRLAAADLVAVLDTLSEIGAGDAAELMALEATGYWKQVR